MRQSSERTKYGPDGKSDDLIIALHLSMARVWIQKAGSHGATNFLPCPINKWECRAVSGGWRLTSLSLRSLGLDALLVFENSPIEDVVVLEALADEEIAEELAEVAVVGLVIEAQRAHIVEVRRKLLRESLACRVLCVCVQVRDTTSERIYLSRKLLRERLACQHQPTAAALLYFALLDVALV